MSKENSYKYKCQKIINGTLVCNRCKKRKKLNRFQHTKKSRDGYRRVCIVCEKKYYQVYKNNHADRIKETQKRYNRNNPNKIRSNRLKYKFGITLEDYNKILESQNYSCAICKRGIHKFNRNLAVDHNHKTGHIRGLLCTYCNSRVLLHLKDKKDLARGLVEYLIKALENDVNWKEDISWKE